MVAKAYVYHLNLNEMAMAQERFAAVLRDDERARAKSILSPVAASCFVVVRGALRQVLGRHLDAAPQEVVLRYESFGKPVVAVDDGRPQVHFNVSHSGDHAVIGICAEAPIGVDVEAMRDRPRFLQLAERFFHAEERAWIGSLMGREAQLDAFYRCWTMKEACVKAVGVGIAGGLRNFQVCRRSGEVNGFVKLPVIERELLVRALSPGGAYGALAVAAEACDFVETRFSGK